MEIMYDMYNPTIQKIEVLKLEKRLDEELFYLRDAPQEFSTVSFNFEVVPHPPGAPVPVNDLQVLISMLSLNITALCDREKYKHRNLPY